MSKWGETGNPCRVDVRVGSVIDLRDAHLIGKPGMEHLLAVIRSENKMHKIDLFAPKSCSELIFGRITAITQVTHTTNRVSGRVLIFTHANVELEDAFGCEPDLIAENSALVVSARSNKKPSEGEWQRPEFTMGDVKNGEEEK